MDWSNLIPFCIAFFLSAAAPGPSNIAVFARSMTTGFWQTAPMLVGLIVGELFFVGFAVFGLALVAKSLGAFFLVVKWLGALYLAYLAYQLWTSPVATPTIPDTQTTKANAKPSDRRPIRQFLLGLALVLGNPKTIAFYLAIVPVVIDLSVIDLGGFMLLILIVLVIYTPVLVIYAIGASRIGQAIRNTAALRAINRTAAAAMAGAAHGGFTTHRLLSRGGKTHQLTNQG
ncbi:MAG: LysE family translocator [Pseudomonadota bacterium]